ncbi:hypothetical protein HAX54_027669 [Datura stramonium]|uniref:Uncharacterized protein n=1 Tax=Datura stramonium TaxID=4076 RepID=A0ABS8V2W2_DATST|nr:hypothetical protein [Datura stramonium]
MALSQPFWIIGMVGKRWMCVAPRPSQSIAGLNCFHRTRPLECMLTMQSSRNDDSLPPIVVITGSLTLSKTPNQRATLQASEVTPWLVLNPLGLLDLNIFLTSLAHHGLPDDSLGHIMSCSALATGKMTITVDGTGASLLMCLRLQRLPSHYEELKVIS